MTQNEDKKKELDKKEAEKQNADASVKPDPETLHTTDPQDHMKGPISSLVHGVQESMEDNDKEEERDKEGK